MKYSVTKERNFINFYQEGKEKPYYLDINTGIFYGISDKPISKLPIGFRDWINTYTIENNLLLSFIRKIINFRNTIHNLETYNSYLRIIDKLASIGYTNQNISYDFSNFIKILDKINKNFKLFCKYYKNNPETTIEEYINIYEEEEFFKSININLENYSPEIVKIIKEHKNDFSNKEFPLMIYYITHGLYEFFRCEPQTNSYINYEEKEKIDNMIEQIKFYFKMCEEINILPEKGDFFKLFINAKKTYTTIKKYKNNNRLTEIYNKIKDFFYENDEFSIVFPDTQEKFFREGEEQRNCVYNCYFEEVLKEQTYIVFIRKKENLEKSYITCEISKKGKIRQFKGKANSQIKDKNALKFKEEYQSYLYNILKNK